MNILEALKGIRTIILDVDGVLTNNQLHITEQGHLLRSMNVKDGYAIHRAGIAGLKIAVITGGKSEGVVKRLKGLDIVDIYTNCTDKMEAFEELVMMYELDKSQILYLGDDIPDLPVMMQVGFAACPADAAPEIKRICKYISPYKGGEGCVRDLIEKILKLQGKWP